MLMVVSLFFAVDRFERNKSPLGIAMPHAITSCIRPLPFPSPRPLPPPSPQSSMLNILRIVGWRDGETSTLNFGGEGGRVDDSSCQLRGGFYFARTGTQWMVEFDTPWSDRPYSYACRIMDLMKRMMLMMLMMKMFVFYYFEALQNRSLTDMNWRRPVHETLPGKTFIMKPACFMGRCVLAQDELEANTTAQLVVEVVVMVLVECEHIG